MKSVTQDYALWKNQLEDLGPFQDNLTSLWCCCLQVTEDDVDNKTYLNQEVGQGVYQ